MAIELFDQILGHVRNAIVPRRVPLLDWKMKRGDVPGASKPSFKDKSWADIRIPFEWGKYDETTWFRCTVTVPDEFAGKAVGLALTFPEALLYVNGEPHCGLDKNHLGTVLTEKSRRNQTFTLAVEAYAGRTNHHHLFDRAEFVEVNLTARTLHNSLKALHDLEMTFDHQSAEATQVRELIRRTLVFLKYFAPDGEEYPNAIARALSFLQTAIGTEFSSSLPGLIHLVGQSHIDVAWLWKISETERKVGRTFSTALRLINEHPGFVYAQSQAALYDMARRRYPGLYREIKQRVAEQRWEPVGSMWVEPDCNIPSGESLVRQIVHGSRFFEQEFGTTSEVLWLPDTFGYTWSLPQLLKKAGINYFFTTKLRWNDTTTFPHTSFWWQGIDGTRILSHVSATGLEAQVTPQDIQKTAEYLEEEEPLPLLQTFGFGDGGGGPMNEHIDAASVLRNIPGLPQSRLSSPVTYFRELEPFAQQLPVWNKELYLEKHRGTYTTHAAIKKANRRAEEALMIAEVLSTHRTILGLGTTPYPAAELDKAWKKLLLNQFHDIVPGTSIHDAMNEAKTDLAEVRSSADAIASKALAAMVLTGVKGKEITFAVFNPLAHVRDAYVEVTVPPFEAGVTVTDDHGKALDHQVLERSRSGLRLLVYVSAVPGFGFSSLHVRQATSEITPSPLGWKFASRSVETPRLRLRFDNKGGLSSVFDKSIKRELIQKGKRANAFMTFRDTPKAWEAWDIDADTERHRMEIFTFKGAKVIEQGPIRATIRQEFRSEAGSVITQLIRLYHRSSRIDFDTTVRWKEHHTLLKVAFPVAVRPAVASYEIQFGVVERPTRSKEPSDKARFEVPAQHWAALTDGKFGGALINDSKYGYDCKDNNLRLTLLRSPRYPHPIEPMHQTDSAFTDVGDHHFRYAFQPFAGDWRTGRIVHEANAFNVPVVVRSGSVAKKYVPVVSVNKASISVSALKRAEDGNGFIVRMVESHGQPTDATIAFGKRPASVVEVDLREREVKPLSAKTGKLAIRFKPFEIKTFRILYSGKKH